MGWIRSTSNIFLILASTFVAFLILEVGYRGFVWFRSPPYVHRSMLFQNGENFENFDGFFKYRPDINIRTSAIYSRDQVFNLEDVLVEYDYTISTNNLGLVMRNDVRPGEEVLLVLGDSFTEGQGASPWFYDLESGRKEGYQAVNLGILGTGPQHWESLFTYVKKKKALIVKGIVINIIPDDIQRKPWVFSEKELACLRNMECSYQYSFQGFNYLPDESLESISARYASKINGFQNRKKADHVQNSSRELASLFIMEFCQSVYSRPLVSDLSTWFCGTLFGMSRPRVHPGIEKQVMLNFEALRRVFREMSPNVVVNIISQKGVSSSTYYNYNYSRRLVEFLDQNEIDYHWCDIPPEEFHSLDSHPTEKGYRKVRACTENALSAF